MATTRPPSPPPCLVRSRVNNEVGSETFLILHARSVSVTSFDFEIFLFHSSLPLHYTSVTCGRVVGSGFPLNMF